MTLTLNGIKPAVGDTSVDVNLAVGDAPIQATGVNFEDKIAEEENAQSNMDQSEPKKFETKEIAPETPGIEQTEQTERVAPDIEETNMVKTNSKPAEEAQDHGKENDPISSGALGISCSASSTSLIVDCC